MAAVDDENDVDHGLAPFAPLLVAGAVLLTVFPQIALWLPSVFFAF